MLRRVRDTLAALAFGSTVGVGVVFGTVCSVDRAGLSNGDASISSYGGSSGGSSSKGGSGAAGTGAGGKGGASALGSGGAGSGQTGGVGGGNAAIGGAPGTGGGNDGTGGASATGGVTGTGGAPATGGVTGTGGAPATGGVTGTGGAPATGGVTGAGGAPATGGDTGSGGAPATGGTMGTGGATGGISGTGGSHTPSCSSFPRGPTFVPPTDNLLHCYWIHGDGSDWDSSESNCVSEGGTLATILSSQENMFVLGVLTQGGLFMGSGVSLGATDGRSIDDRSGAGTYAWVTGEPWNYHNWNMMGQPDGSCMCQGNNNNCACDHRLVMLNDGTWYDRPANMARPYICEAIAR
jgi:hypothetical protein